MTDHPILMRDTMVQALLAGRKTQTRRMAWRPCEACKGKRYVDIEPLPGHDLSVMPCDNCKPTHWWKVRAGDRLWVRESFWGCDLPGHGDQPCVIYDEEHHGDSYSPMAPRPYARKFGRIPSIHMPRGCSRLTLNVTADARPERLQDISEGDAKAEGVGATLTDQNLRNVVAPAPPGRYAWWVHWKSLHTKPGERWEDNPELAVLAFDVIHGNIDEVAQ